MIYRIVAERLTYVLLDAETGERGCEGTGSEMRGIFRAGFSKGFGDLKITWIEHPRVRFYFTEEGWQIYGRRVAATAKKQGIIFRVRKDKNPDKSRIVYEDKYQVVLLPSRTRTLST